MISQVWLDQYGSYEPEKFVTPQYICWGVTSPGLQAFVSEMDWYVTLELACSQALPHANKNTASHGATVHFFADAIPFLP